MTDFDPLKIIKALAISDPKLLIMIASLPEINCDTFEFEKWGSQIEGININTWDNKVEYIADLFYGVNTKVYSSCIRYIDDNDGNEPTWLLLYYKNNKRINTKSMSELIHTCKGKEIKELLNFI